MREQQDDPALAAVLAADVDQRGTAPAGGLRIVRVEVTSHAVLLCPCWPTNVLAAVTTLGTNPSLSALSARCTDVL